MNNRIDHLFNNNGDDTPEEHPLERWEDWIRIRHPKLVNQMIDEVNKMEGLYESDLPGIYTAIGRVMMLSGSQFFFDVATGVIFPDLQLIEDRVKEFPPKFAMNNVANMRKRAHEIIDELFDQYTEEYHNITKDLK